MSGYFPRYDLPAELAPGDAAWLAREQGGGPLDLCDVTDVCALLGVSATLYDAAGRELGKVHPDGSYRLGAP